MTSSVTVLLACDDSVPMYALAEEMKQLPNINLTVTQDGENVPDLAMELSADVVICGSTVGETDGLDICRALKADGRTAYSLLLFLTANGYRETKQLALQSGVDAFLSVPLEPEDVSAFLGQAQRFGALREQWLQCESRLKANGRNVDQVVSLLVNLIDARLPGATFRGEKLASLARMIADKFEIPKSLLKELDIAARLQEIGKIVNPSAAAYQLAPEYRTARNGPTYTIVSRAVLSELDFVSGAAEIVGSMCENWDGTGLPDRLCKGQIPLRSRILRVLVDFLEALADPALPPAADVVSQLADHSGTRYDPLLIVHFRAVIDACTISDQVGDKTRIPVGELSTGMVLADDIFTSSGVKLLAGGAVLTGATLDVIKRRNQVDPVVSGVWIRNRAN